MKQLAAGVIEEPLTIHGVRGTLVGLVEFEFVTNDSRKLKLPLELSLVIPPPGSFLPRVIGEFGPVLEGIIRARERDDL